MALAAVVMMSAVTLERATAQTFLTGTNLLAECERESDLVCIGYLLGVADAILTTDRLAAAPARRDDPQATPEQRGVVLTYCLPEGLGMTEMKEAVVLFLRANPAQLRRTASSLVRGALLDAYPCPR